MDVVNVHEAKTHLSKLLERVAQGEEITLGKAGKPVARLVPIEKKTRKRRLGDLKGKIWMAEDFDETDQEIIDMFEGKYEDPA